MRFLICLLLAWGAAACSTPSAAPTLAPAGGCEQAFVEWRSALQDAEEEEDSREDLVAALLLAEDRQITAFEACDLREFSERHDAAPFLDVPDARVFVEIECQDEGPPMSDTGLCREVLDQQR